MKQQGRKPKKRPPGRPKIDDDLAELASMLDEQRLDASISNWFSIPWRDGWAAVSLAWALCDETHPDHWAPDTLGRPAWDVITRMITRRSANPELYGIAETNLTSLRALAQTVDTVTSDACLFLIAAFRCVQLLISNSSGGGHGYNVVLLYTFEHLSVGLPIKRIANEVRITRCLDAIGTSIQFKNDHNDRLRRAFTIAWDRGLYQAAYALPRAS